MPSDRVPSLEILLVVDNEIVARRLSAILGSAGHRVTAATTIAGAVETLMRRGPYVDVIMTSTRLDASLGDDIVEYSRKFAARAQLVVLSDAASRIEDLELARPPVRDRHRTMGDWD